MRRLGRPAEHRAAAAGGTGRRMSVDTSLIEDALSELRTAEGLPLRQIQVPERLLGVGRTSKASLSQSQISAFVTHNAIITVRREGQFDLTDLLRRWDDNSALIARGVGGVLHCLLDLDRRRPLRRGAAARRRHRRHRGRPLRGEAAEQETQHRAFRLRKSLVQLRSVVLPMRELVGSLQREDARADPVLAAILRRAVRPRPACDGVDRVAARRRSPHLR